MQKTCAKQLGYLPDRGQGRLHHPSALEHYLVTYRKPELPPSWLMVETLALGQLSMVYRNLRRRADKTAVARSVGLTAPLLSSWLETYVRVRNICAHHGRLWNVGLGDYPKIPTSSKVSWPRGQGAPPQGGAERRLYPVLASLQTMLERISPRSSWAERLADLLEGKDDIVYRGMGVPAEWSGDEFWARQIRSDS